MMMNPPWLTWSQRLQALAQTGLTYAKDEFDVERYREIQQIAAEMMAAGFETGDPAAIQRLFLPDTGYATPKVDVRAAVFNHSGHLLLVREREDGCWSLPGGWADIGDAPSVAAVREVREESGYEVAARKLLMVYDRNLHGHPAIPYHAYKLFFLCELTGGTSTHSHETDGVDFFPENALPPLSLTRNTAAQIARLFEHARHPEWPTEFD